MSFRTTIRACWLAYIVQAVVNGFLPLLFVHLQSEYGIHMTKVTMLITINFSLQLLTDLGSAFVVKKAGIRTSMVLANLFAASGMILLGILPRTYTSLVLCVILNAIGGGLLEVLVSPIVEACPSEDSRAAMSLLHSFYCWGVSGVVLLSTLFFRFFGMERWHLLSALWAFLPLICAVLFAFVPLNQIEEEGRTMSGRTLFRSPSFWILFVMMLCSGACEHSMSQWASAFAEQGLHISKTAGDLAGPCAFSILMGTARVIAARLTKTDLKKYMICSSLVCMAGYALAAFSTQPLLGLLGCGIVGFGVGVMWPGTFTIAARLLPNGGTTMYALLALAGDGGCSSGPTITGLVSSAQGGMLQAGMKTAILFPLIMILVLLVVPETEK